MENTSYGKGTGLYQEYYQGLIDACGSSKAAEVLSIHYEWYDDLILENNRPSIIRDVEMCLDDLLPILWFYHLAHK